MNQNIILADDLRLAHAQNLEMGCGNFVHYAVKAHPTPEASFFFFDKEVTSFKGEKFTEMSLTDLKRLTDEYAAWYYGVGIREKDPVAVYLDEGIKNLVHYTALTAIGAIPILINGNMKPEIAAGFVKKVGATALFTDVNHESAISAHLDTWLLKFVATDETAVHTGTPALPANYPYKHHEKDTVLVGHSSGTTGIPKAVIFQHQQFFFGIRYRLGLPFPKGSERILSALPHSHSAGIAYVMLAVLNGSATMVLSSNKPKVVLPSIEKFKPSMVVAFPETYVELCEQDFSKYDLSSVNLWFNGGDAAHETHIRKLVSTGHRNRDGKKIPGSVFIDGLGSSEMGFSLFRMVHTPETNQYNRCIGVPLEFVDAAVIGENGEKLPPYRIGKLGVKSPSITPGYWNDSVLTMRSQVQGYWLTGDMFYHDEKNQFFHVDRIPDVIRTADGPVYSLQTEEFLMKHFPELADCTVVGAPDEKGNQVPIALIRLKASSQAKPAEMKARFNEKLATENRLPLQHVLQPEVGTIPLGPTGKVLKRELRDQYRCLFANEGNKTLSQERTRIWAPASVSA